MSEELKTTIGDEQPRDYPYRLLPRFGFSVDLAKYLRHPFPRDNFMALKLKAAAIPDLRGRVRYPKAFGLCPEWTN
jgi:predicted N-acetyltransferase YhbS